MRGVTTLEFNEAQANLFLLTRLMRGVTGFCNRHNGDGRISTHTPHARRDRRVMALGRGPGRFLLTRLMRGVTYTPRFGGWSALNFYSHASCEA